MNRMNQILETADAAIQAAPRNNANRTITNAVLCGLAACAVATAQWTPITPMIAPSYRSSAATGPDGRIYLTGGSTGYYPSLSNAYRYDPVATTWAPVANMNQVRESHATVTGCDGLIYVIGGLDHWRPPSFNRVGTVESYNTATNQWTYQPSLVGAYDYVVAAVDRACQIHAFGINYSNPNSFVEEVFAGGVWNAGGTYPINDEIYGAVSAHNGSIYLLGWSQYYQWDGNIWAPQGFTPWPRGFSSTLGVDGKVYMLGGATNEFSANFVTQTPAMKFGSNKDTSYYMQSLGNGTAATAAGRVFSLGGAQTGQVEAYSPMKAAVGPYEFWWKTVNGSAYSQYTTFCNAGSPSVTSLNRVPGRVDSAVRFDGSPSAPGLSFPSTCSPQIADGDFTIEFWMKQNGAGTAVQSILDKRSANAGRGYHVWFYTVTNQVYLQTNDGSGPRTVTSTIPIPLNTWTHVAITVSRTGGRGAIWVNAVKNQPDFVPMTGSFLTSEPLTVGTRNSANFGGADFNGALDEITFYKRALTFPEVRSIFLAGAQGKQ